MINDIIMWQPCQKHDSISIQKKIINISWSWLLKLSWGPMICVSPDVHIYSKHFTRARHRSTQLCEVELLHAPTYRTCRVPRVSTMCNKGKLPLNIQTALQNSLDVWKRSKWYKILSSHFNNALWGTSFFFFKLQWCEHTRAWPADYKKLLFFMSTTILQ